MSMEFIESILELLADLIDIFGIGILLVGSVWFIAHYFVFEFKRFDIARVRELRLELGAYILLSLEFLIVSDIIHTALSRTLEDFYVLGLLIIIRTTIEYFMGREVKEMVESGR